MGAVREIDDAGRRAERPRHVADLVRVRAIAVGIEDHTARARCWRRLGHRDRRERSRRCRRRRELFGVTARDREREGDAGGRGHDPHAR